ncbi:aspartate dehydrogenase [Candidatus Bathyarchaeota archaeon]|nr:aspartate dehydrogenase [Candidatus Bathyarchaeota archaeon]
MTAVNAGLIGCGAIGTVIAEAIDSGKAGEMSLVMIYDLIRERAEKLASKLSRKPLIAKDADELLNRDDIQIVIEAASQEAVKQYAIKTLLKNKDFMVMSAGALLDEPLLNNILEAARNNDRKVYVPSGAIVGLDNVKSAAVGRIEEITLTTRKPPMSFEGAPYVERGKINLSSLKEPLVLYEGTAREAVKLFPQNVNVAASLSLAGVGPDKTKVRIIVDPSIKHIVHEIHVRGDFGEIYTRTINKPFPNNPRTSYIAALSAIATLRKISGSIIVGT